MPKDYVEIMDIRFLNITKQKLLQSLLIPSLKHGRRRFIVTANPEIVMHAKKELPYKEAVQSADIVIPDGIGIIMAAKYKNTPLKERIPGIELMEDLLKHANDHALRCYFLGAKPKVLEKTIHNIKEQYPQLVITGHHHGYFDDDEKIIQDIQQTEPDLVFVALGMPRQEMWIHQHLKKFSKGIFIGVGGSFDVMAGEVKRAPKLWIKLHLEWLYRLLKQPSRFFRVLKLFQFMFRILIGRG